MEFHMSFCNLISKIVNKLFQKYRFFGSKTNFSKEQIYETINQNQSRASISLARLAVGDILPRKICPSLPVSAIKQMLIFTTTVDPNLFFLEKEIGYAFKKSDFL